MATPENEQASAGFPPIAAADAKILILGSLPGQRSLAESEYYAHRQNAFWPIMAALFGVGGSYASRCEQVKRQGLAVWDVLAHSVRLGSMDADIRLDTAVPNDFSGFLSAHTDVKRICFNGRKAELLFEKLVIPNLATPLPELISLPSTSPAYAKMSFNDKLDDWASKLVNEPLTARRTL